MLVATTGFAPNACLLTLSPEVPVGACPMPRGRAVVVAVSPSPNPASAPVSIRVSFGAGTRTISVSVSLYPADRAGRFIIPVPTGFTPTQIAFTLLQSTVRIPVMVTANSAPVGALP